ncbi:protein of unknown function [Mesotoga infera]|uniref:Uncharacterized protein n=1 Tax=Mesotoga infera TaxID=1236046 RepID=A0A7Z7LDF8_9BACT|nr:protein of unknown function [Mesotoga infera]
MPISFRCYTLLKGLEDAAGSRATIVWWAVSNGEMADQVRHDGKEERTRKW